MSYEDTSITQRCSRPVVSPRTSGGLLSGRWLGISRYWQDFYPAQGMCVEGVQWYQDDSGTAHGEGMKLTLESCAAAGNTWYQPRRFELGQWDTEATCKRGVCNTEPWNWELADVSPQISCERTVCTSLCR
jgi:hypothetical protein